MNITAKTSEIFFEDSKRRYAITWALATLAITAGACVEMSVVVDRAGFHLMHVGALPAECALLTSLSRGIEELAIEGSLAGDPQPSIAPSHMIRSPPPCCRWLRSAT